MKPKPKKFNVVLVLRTPLGWSVSMDFGPFDKWEDAVDCFNTVEWQGFADDNTEDRHWTLEVVKYDKYGAIVFMNKTKELT